MHEAEEGCLQVIRFSAVCCKSLWLDGLLGGSKLHHESGPMYGPEWVLTLRIAYSLIFSTGAHSSSSSSPFRGPANKGRS